MTNKTLIILPILITVFFNSCRKPEKKSGQPTDYSEAYKYFPMAEGREWVYENVQVDANNALLDTFILVAKYNKVQGRTDYYRDGILDYNAYWQNSGSIMGCCVDVVLIDYDELGCKSDSVMIFNKKDSSIDMRIYQYCSEQYAVQVPGYQQVKCVTTRQINVFPSGNSLEIVHLFGYGIGLVLRSEITRDYMGKITGKETQKLKSHNF